MKIRKPEINPFMYETPRNLKIGLKSNETFSTFFFFFEAVQYRDTFLSENLRPLDDRFRNAVFSVVFSRYLSYREYLKRRSRSDLPNSKSNL